MSLRDCDLIILDDFIYPTQANSIERNMINAKSVGVRMRDDDSNFSWYHHGEVISSDCEEKDTPKKYQYMFVHSFFETNLGIITDKTNWNLIQPIIEKLGVGQCLRIKANLYPNTEKIYTHGFHMDLPYTQVLSAIYFVNSNDGYTYFKPQDDKSLIKVESKKNRLVVFPNGLLHSGTTCTDEGVRVVINFNYICSPNHPHYKHYYG